MSASLVLSLCLAMSYLWIEHSITKESHGNVDDVNTRKTSTSRCYRFCRRGLAGLDCEVSNLVLALNLELTTGLTESGCLYTCEYRDQSPRFWIAETSGIQKRIATHVSCHIILCHIHTCLSIVVTNLIVKCTTYVRNATSALTRVRSHVLHDPV